jgi:alkyldihydroxyacetonephosphate synthase
VHWEQRRFDWSWFTDNVGVAGGIAEAIELSTTWSELPSLYEAVTKAAATVMPNVMGHVSHIYDQGASLYVISSGRFDDDESAMEAYDRLWSAVMEATLDQDARISHHHGIGLERAGWLERSTGATALNTLRQIKATLDPAGIMNPGKLGL